MELFWLGGVAEKDDFDKMLENGNTQIAANITQLNYIEGLEEITGKSIKILNSHYEPSYPKYKKLFIKRRVWKRKEKENIDIGFINIPILKYINKVISLRMEMKKIIKNDLSNRETNVFFVYAMTMPLMLLARYIKKYVRDKNFLICLIVPDLPEFMNMNKLGIIKSILSRFNRKIIYSCMKYIDKYILFAKPMAEYLHIDKDKYIVIEGMVNFKNIMEKEKIIQEYGDEKKYIMYAGGINEKYGVLNLVKAFNQINNRKFELWLYGAGDAVDQIEQLSKKNSRIKYKGVVTNEEVLIAEKNATLLINPRPTNEEYTKYSFPSKNLEYMLSGTPLLTTKLPSMPKEYYKYVFILEDESINGFEKKLKELLNKDDLTLFNKGKEAKQFVMERKNNIEQTKEICNFINMER